MTPSAKELFQDALDVPPLARLAWLRDKCGGDDALFAKVEALLSAHDDATRLDRGPRIALTEPHLVAPSATSAAPAERPGAVIDGRYELISLLGEGGFGIVYRARQLSPVVRDVALKILRGGLDSHQIVARFEAERQTLALMDHPGIARVYDAGETAQGRPYIAMEFVDGEPITAYCERHALGLEERLRLVEQVCMAIQHAHTKGVIHRDLKPTNILVTTLDGAPFPTVIDFGIAKAVDPDASAILHGGAQLTQEFQIVGTPQYMSPEQATRGAAAGGGVDTRSDVYSIGTVLYELVAGVPPFDPAELRKAGLEGVLRVIRERTPARPSTRLLSVDATSAPGATTTRTFGEAPSRLSRRVAGDVDWIVMRALEKEPARRYQSAADFAADIRRHLSHEPVLAGPPSRLYQARKFVRRHRAAVAAAAVVAVALVATAVVSVASARRAGAAERVALDNAARAAKAEGEARENERLAERELAKANAVVAFTQKLLAGVAPAVARGRDTTLLREILDEAVQTAPSALKDEAMIDLVVRHLIATVKTELGEMQSAYDVLWPAWKATEGVTDREDVNARLIAGEQIGELLGELGRLDDAKKFLEGLLAEYEKLGMGQSDEALDILHALAANAIDRSDYAEARRLAERAIEIIRVTGNADWEKLEASKDRLANALFFLGDYDGSIKTLQENLAVTIEHKGADAPEVASIQTSLGASYKQLGKMDEAERYLRDALASSRKLYEAGNPRLLMSMSVYGDMLESAGRFAESAKILEEAKATSTLKLPPEHAVILTIDGRLAKACVGLKRYDEAIALDREVLAVTLKATPVDEGQISAVLASLMQAQLGAGRPRDALASLAEFTPKAGWTDAVLPFFRATLDISEGRSRLMIGELDAARGLAARARDWFKQEGRTSGRYFRTLGALEADIAAAATQPSTRTSATQDAGGAK